MIFLTKHYEVYSCNQTVGGSAAFPPSFFLLSHRSPTSSSESVQLPSPMEIEGEDGSRIQLRAGSEAVFGRGSGFRSADRTVSRRHLLFRADDGRTEPARVSFEVLGKNPVWVRSGGGEEVRVYRTFEKGELAAGDWLCASGRLPIWFAVKAIDCVRDLGSDSEAEPESSYIPENDIDPVKGPSFFCF